MKRFHPSLALLAASCVMAGCAQSTQLAVAPRMMMDGVSEWQLPDGLVAPVAMRPPGLKRDLTALPGAGVSTGRSPDAVDVANGGEFNVRPDAPWKGLSAPVPLPATPLAVTCKLLAAGQTPATGTVGYTEGVPFTVVFRPGAAFAVLDGDATDGEATLQLPEGSYEGFADAVVLQRGHLGVEDPIYFMRAPIRNVDSGKWFSLGARPVTQPASYGRGDSRLSFDPVGVTQLLLRFTAAAGSPVPPLPPQLSHLQGPGALATRQVGTLAATATDANGDALDYRWSVTGPAGDVSTVAGGAAVDWQAPSDVGRYRLTLEVRDPYFTTFAPQGLVAEVTPHGFATPLAGRMNVARRDHGSVVIDGRLYVVGGFDGSRWVRSVESATVNSDGSHGAFTTLPLTTTHDTSYTTCLVHGRTLYAISPYGWMDVATVKADGSLTPFVYTPAAAGLARFNPEYAVVGDYLYAVGGESQQTTNGVVYHQTLDTVVRARIGADGMPGAFTPVEPKLVRSRLQHSVVVTGNRLTVVGGRNLRYTAAQSPTTGVWTYSPVTADVLAETSVEQADILADGSITPFREVATALWNGVSNGEGAAVATPHMLYLVYGGRGDIEQAPIGLDGSLGAFTWSSSARLDTDRFGLSKAVVGGRLYMSGGFDQTRGENEYAATKKSDVPGWLNGTVCLGEP